MPEASPHKAKLLPNSKLVVLKWFADEGDEGEHHLKDKCASCPYTKDQPRNTKSTCDNCAELWCHGASLVCLLCRQCAYLRTILKKSAYRAQLTISVTWTLIDNQLSITQKAPLSPKRGSMGLWIPAKQIPNPLAYAVAQWLMTHCHTICHDAALSRPGVEHRWSISGQGVAWGETCAGLYR